MVIHGYLSQTWSFCSPLLSSYCQPTPAVNCFQWIALLLDRQGQGTPNFFTEDIYLLLIASLSSPSRTPSPRSSLPRSKKSRSSESMQILLLCLPSVLRQSLTVVESVQGAWQQGPRRSHPRHGLWWCSWCEVPCLGGTIPARREYMDQQLTEEIGLSLGR